MKFKLLFYFCFYILASCFDFVHQLSTATRSLFKLSSAAKFCFDCGIPYALFYFACFVCYVYGGDHVNCVITVLGQKLHIEERKKIAKKLIHFNSTFLSKSQNFILAKYGSSFFAKSIEHKVHKP